jgi:hypothetical protein
VNVLKSARRHNRYTVEVLEHTDFFDLKELAKKVVSNRRKSTTGNVINWLNVRWIRLEKASLNTILFKTDFDQPSFDIMVQSRSSRPSSFKLVPAYKRSLPISAAKYSDLQSMLKSGIIPTEYAAFYQSLPSDDRVQNLTPDNSDDE